MGEFAERKQGGMTSANKLLIRQVIDQISMDGARYAKKTNNLRGDDMVSTGELLFGDYTYQPGTFERQLHGLDTSPKRDKTDKEDDVQLDVLKGAQVPFVEKEVYEGPLLNPIPLRK